MTTPQPKLKLSPHSTQKDNFLITIYRVIITCQIFLMITNHPPIANFNPIFFFSMFGGLQSLSLSRSGCFPFRTCTKTRAKWRDPSLDLFQSGRTYCLWNGQLQILSQCRKESQEQQCDVISPVFSTSRKTFICQIYPGFIFYHLLHYFNDFDKVGGTKIFIFSFTTGSLWTLRKKFITKNATILSASHKGLNLQVKE